MTQTGRQTPTAPTPMGGFEACEQCGAYEAVAPERLAEVKDLIERELGYRPRFTHFPIVGLCARCKGDYHAHP